MKPPVEQYIRSLETVLAPHFAPDGIYHGESGALRLAREVGYGLASYANQEIAAVMGGLYGRLLVRFTLASGVPLSAQPWLAEMKTIINVTRSSRGA
ncbi:MAG: hypothetical protein Kow0031_10830 [Anaerolineae bacterium]